MTPYTPLLRPRRYFATHDVAFVRVAAVFGILLMAGPMTVYGVGWVLTSSVDGTVLVDNPERPPDVFCPEEGCDEPERIERDVDAVLWDLMDRFVGPAFAVYPLVVLGATLLLHAGVWLAGRGDGWFPTLAVAAWGLLPAVLLVGVTLVAMRGWVDPVVVSPGDDLSAAFGPLEAQLRAFRPYGRAASVVAAAWGGLIWRAGLIEHQGLPGTEATAVAGVVALLDAAVAGLL